MKSVFALKIEKQIVLSELKSYTRVLLGSTLLSAAYALLIIPHNIVPGGILGLSIVIKEVTGFSVGYIALLINIPLLLWGTKVLGAKTGLKTLVSMVLVSFYIDMISSFTGGKVFIDDVLMSSIFGGVIIGFAIAMVMNAGATTGGNDILVRILSTKIRLPYNKLILAVDGSVVILGAVVFADFTMAAYSIVAIVAISKTIEYYMKKSVQNKTILVFSTKNILIQEEILLNKKSTDGILKLIHHDSNEKMILVTRNTKKLDVLKNIILRIDPEAQINVLESNNILD
ncbi:YitT family protein [Aequorivita marina]|uniref:YitT family protein n=1 Tax=Aequorivita marina TaxID=3073654 RepID=UPI002874245E|nr:YitT family protein [Aequorivita sp. S2608]MDS1297758.1 YitT family protein [Aequorivita sp. S2608]